MDVNAKVDVNAKKKKENKTVSFKVVPPYNMDEDDLVCMSEAPPFRYLPTKDHRETVQALIRRACSIKSVDEIDELL